MFWVIISFDCWWDVTGILLISAVTGRLSVWLLSTFLSVTGETDRHWASQSHFRDDSKHLHLWHLPPLPLPPSSRYNIIKKFFSIKKFNLICIMHISYVLCFNQRNKGGIEYQYQNKLSADFWNFLLTCWFQNDFFLIAVQWIYDVILLRWCEARDNGVRVREGYLITR